METIKIALFRGKEIRKDIHKNEWWFSILDIIGVLTDSPQPKTYWAKMKDRDKEISQPFPFWEQLKLLADTGNARKQTEKEIGRSVVSRQNYLQTPKNPTPKNSKRV